MGSEDTSESLIQKSHPYLLIHAHFHPLLSNSPVAFVLFSASLLQIIYFLLILLSMFWLKVSPIFFLLLSYFLLSRLLLLTWTFKSILFPDHVPVWAIQTSAFMAVYSSNVLPIKVYPLIRRIRISLTAINWGDQLNVAPSHFAVTSRFQHPNTRTHALTEEIKNCVLW